MGQCYSVYLAAKIKDADEFVRLSRNYAIANGWSADWIGGDVDTVERVLPYLEWDADDISTEMIDDPNTGAQAPTIVVCAYPKKGENT